MQKRIAFVIGMIFTLSIFAACQGKPSPAPSASCDLGGGKTIKTDYSSPRMKGRKVYGDLVPFGEVWRTGANDATTFITSADVVVGGKTIPAADKWTLIVSKKTGEWGIPYKYESDELARVDMKVSKLPSPLENFTIAYGKSGSGCTLQIDWETTRASVDISAK